MDKYMGKRLDGRYEIQELIGVGGMAYVYKAYDTVDAREVAIKILKDEYMANAEFTRRFKNESKAIAILSHPNIVKVLDVSFGDRIQYIVMEYIDGITLKEYIEQQRVTWKEAVHFTTQILKALQHAHDKGIVHRDIKPQNIMLLADGTIKVTDFGIARFSRNDIRTGLGDKAIGSVHYISPEQARGAFTDEKADIYSVGVMLYEMLTGKLPFDADNAVSVAIMQLQSQPEKPSSVNPQIPEGLEEITLKAMQKDPEKRYQSAAEMLQDINEFKQNPSIRFEYKYFVDETPTRFVDAITTVKGESEAENAEERKGPPMVPILTGVAAAFVLVALLIVGIVGVKNGWFKLGETPADNLIVPNFVTREYQSLKPEEISGFVGQPILNYENSDTYKEGVIIKQEPAPQKSIKPNTRQLTLTISKGPLEIVLPEVKGQKEDVMIRLLEETKGLKTLVISTSDEKVPEGTVIKLIPAEEKIVKGTLIYVYVSTGTKEPVPIEMESVVGMPLETAKTRLQQLGIAVTDENILIVNDENHREGMVVKQTPEAGEKLKTGENVVLYVSSGSKDVSLRVPLPITEDAVDLVVYLNGKRNDGYSEGLQGLLPMEMPEILINCTEVTKEPYTITLYISPSGKEDYKLYYRYSVDPVKNKATVDESRPYEGDSTSVEPIEEDPTVPPIEELPFEA